MAYVTFVRQNVSVYSSPFLSVDDTLKQILIRLNFIPFTFAVISKCWDQDITLCKVVLTLRVAFIEIKHRDIPYSIIFTFCLFVYSGPRPSPVMGCPYSGILTSNPRGWRVCNTPSSQEGTLSTPKGYGEGPGRILSQVREGTCGQFYPNTTKEL